MSAPGFTGERQEYLDAIISFAGVGQRRRLFRGLDISHNAKRATGDLPEECRFLLNTQLMFLKKEKDPTSKQFDDDEWIRSLTEAQEITTDVPEDSVLYDQQVVEPEESSAHSDGRILAEVCLAAAPRAQRRRNRSSHDSDAAARSWLPRRR